MIVAWNSADDLARTLPALAAELGPQDEVIVVDNDSYDDPASVASRILPSVRVVVMKRNSGYAAGANRGAAEAGGDLLVLLNPDARPGAGFGEAIRRPLEDGSGWAAWMPLVVCREGGREVVNTFGNPLHFTGFSWAGGHGIPVGQAGGSRVVPTLSGACLAIPRTTWQRVGGFAGRFFLYQEDTDLSVRLRLAGHSLGLLAEATVDHDYDFGLRDQKFLWLERNRLSMIVRNYPATLFLLLVPALLATEVVVLVAASRGGWLRSKISANLQLVRWLPGLIGERRRIQASRSIPAGEFAAAMTPDLDSPFFPDFVRSAPVRLVLRGYWRLVRLLLG